MKTTVVILTLLFFSALPAEAARLKDISAFKGVRTNPLFGYGLVVGLNGTGDGSGSEFTIRSIINMLERMGVHIDRDKLSQVKPKNVAAVMVTAVLPPFAKVGTRVDVTVSSIGDAKNLQGGTLLLTPLKGVDQQVYALAQGQVLTGGFAAGGAAGGGVQKNHPTVGMITKGAHIERELPQNLNGRKELLLTLFNPDFSTAVKIKESINQVLNGPYARPLDSATLSITVPDPYQERVAELIALLEKVEVVPDAVAKVIINERTGTIVLGEHVRISTVAIAHGSLHIQVKESFNVSQPPPLAPPPPRGSATTVVPPEGGIVVAPGGSTVVTPESTVTVKEEGQPLKIVQGGVSLGELIRALNAIGASPRDLISILQSIKAAGALQADLEIL
ncbi:MAG: flagellar basal body P-ring protein FlgI [Desulfobacterota bacterium]|nr:flagellar basal body P-ring protein FlgI [Thermodesulfobacteriota bacterium]